MKNSKAIFDLSDLLGFIRLEFLLFRKYIPAFLAIKSQSFLKLDLIVLLSQTSYSPGVHDSGISISSYAVNILFSS